MTFNVSGKTRLYGVIGDPIEHSLSPALQNAAFAATGTDAVFLAFQVNAAEVDNALLGVRALGICGLNVTMPNKNTVIDDLDEIDPTAQFLGSVNTIKNSNGTLCGYSTDGVGAKKALTENGVELAGKKLVLLGGGGAAKAIAYALAEEAGEIAIFNRNPQRLTPLIEAIVAKNKKVTACALEPKAVQKGLENADLLINATSVGMHPNAKESLVQRQWLKPGLAVMDIVYNPLETKLAKDAKAVGAKVVSGLEMLVYQGAASFELWTGKKAPVQVMREAALRQLSGAKQ
jgi:shikimate dehydrogenase